MRSRRSLATAVAVGLSLALGTSACGGLPGSGSVQQGLEVNGPAADPVRLLPDGPFDGADPVQVVRGFLRAGAGFDEEHVVARSFLSPTTTSSWRPGDQVDVLSDASVRITALSGGRVRVEARTVATIDAEGQYRELHTPGPISAVFTVAKVGGQWRIASTPAQFGLWLTTSDLQRLYRSYAIYYASPQAKVLVPDVRWLPAGAGLATSLSRAQLAPVPGYLSGAVVTGVPNGTRLALEAVPVQGGLATVDLATPGFSTDPGLRQALWAQFVATLVQAPNISQVSLEAAGSAVALPGMHGYPSSLVEVGYTFVPTLGADSGEVLRVGTKLQRINGDGILRDTGDGAGKSAVGALPQVPLGWVGLAMSTDGTRLAAVGGNFADLAVWRGSDLSVVAPFAVSLTRPSFDSHGWVWTGGVPLPKGQRTAASVARAMSGSSPSTVYALDTGAKNGALAPVKVAAPWLAGRRVVALRIAPDGQRAAVVTRRVDGGDVRVQVSGVVRSSDGTPRALTAPLRVGTPLTAAMDLTWVDDQTLAVLGQVAGTSTVRPFVVGIGAETEPLTAVPGARWITSSGDLRGIMVVTTAGQVYERAGSGWAVQTKGSDLAVAGG